MNIFFLFSFPDYTMRLTACLHQLIVLETLTRISSGAISSEDATQGEADLPKWSCEDAMKRDNLSFISTAPPPPATLSSFAMSHEIVQAILNTEQECGVGCVLSFKHWMEMYRDRFLSPLFTFGMPNSNIGGSFLIPFHSRKIQKVLKALLGKLTTNCSISAAQVLFPKPVIVKDAEGKTILERVGDPKYLIHLPSQGADSKKSSDDNSVSGHFDESAPLLGDSEKT